MEEMLTQTQMHPIVTIVTLKSQGSKLTLAICQWQVICDVGQVHTPAHLPDLASAITSHTII